MGQTVLSFDGGTFVHARDAARLLPQLKAVASFMADGEWHTLAEIAKATGKPEASVSARLRDLRKERFGGFDVQREYVHKGLHRYRLAPGWGE